MKLVRRRGRRLLSTPRGRALAADPEALLAVLAAALGGEDPFTVVVADTIWRALADGEQEHDGLPAVAVRAAWRGGWRDPDGREPGPQEASWVVSDVVIRGEAYGLIERDRRAAPGQRHHICLTPAGRALLAPGWSGSAGMDVLIFDAALANVRGVSARLAVRADQHLTALHDAIHEAFGWYDDHLYSFWLDGTFWGEEDTEYTTPDAAEKAPRTADTPLAELDLAVGAKVAYVFDFGDEWRVKLTLRAAMVATNEPA